ncbi:MAG: hypothetical protein JNN15_03960 [Blastocatellia bacterium]|nr:hypothetical protein [Blastocatellia bacterium]
MQSIEFVGILMILISFLLFILEAKAAGFGIFGIAGAIVLIVGLAFIFGLSWASLPMLVAVGLPLLCLFGFVIFMLNRSRKSPVVTGEDGMVGLEGRAETVLEPEGKIYVRGELWDAWSPVRIERGEQVRVTAVRGLKLEVTTLTPEKMIGSQISNLLTENREKKSN